MNCKRYACKGHYILVSVSPEVYQCNTCGHRAGPNLEGPAAGVG